MGLSSRKMCVVQLIYASKSLLRDLFYNILHRLTVLVFPFSRCYSNTCFYLKVYLIQAIIKDNVTSMMTSHQQIVKFAYTVVMCMVPLMEI